MNEPAVLFPFMPPFIVAAAYSVWVTIAGIITISTGYAVWPCY